MNERTFEVPLSCTSELAQILDEHGLEGLIIGRNEDNELLVKVEYEPEEDSQAILEMIEYLEDQKGEGSEEDNEEDE